MADVRRLCEVGFATVAAKELANQIQSGGLQIGTTGTTAMAGNRVPTTTIRGGVLQQTAIPNVSAAPTQADFNGLLAALRAAGILAP